MELTATEKFLKKGEFILAFPLAPNLKVCGSFLALSSVYLLSAQHLISILASGAHAVYCVDGLPMIFILSAAALPSIYKKIAPN